MEIQAKTELLKKVTRQNLTEYLKYSGWKSTESPKDAWLLYVGPKDYYGEPLEIVLSKREDSKAAKEFFASAINLLAALNNETPDVTVQRIQGIDRDILNVRNTGNNVTVSIPLSLATRQTGKLQTLIKAATFSESDALPYYPTGYRHTLADRMANDFQFGHTQTGSFALTIHSPVLTKPIEYKQMSFPGLESIAIETLAPPPRRIVERIVRGLVATKNAVKQENLNSLVHSYTSGFNSNMCKAIVSISRNQRADVEYSVLWSPKIDVPEDIANVSSILLNGTDYAMLKRAAAEMKKLEEEKPVTVSGIIEGLSSQDDPHKFGVGQSIVVKWNRPDLARPIKIIVDLNPDEYLKAIDAHKHFHSVEMSGLAKQIGSKWKLFSPENFRVRE